MILRDRIDEAVVKDTLMGYHRPPEGLDPKVIVDLGCHIGTTMLDLAGLYPEARIYGVEMDPDNAMFAGQVTQRPILCVAISDANGTSVYGGDESWAYRLGEGSKIVPTATLEKVYDAFGLDEVDFLKVDIEGSEDRLFATGAWAYRTRYLKAEIHAPYTVKRAMVDLRNLGFETKVNADHWSCLEAWR